MKTRKYKKLDKKQVQELITSCLIETYKKSPIKKFENFEDYSVFYVVEDKGKIIGCVGLEDEGENIGKLRRLYIHKNYRKNGLGTKLLKKIESFALKNKFNKIILSTNKKLDGTIKFYQKHGFNIYKEETHPWGGKRLLMEKKLCSKY